MGLTPERRGEIAVQALFRLLRDMSANDLNVGKLSGKFSTWMMNLPREFKADLAGVDFDVNQLALMCLEVHTGMKALGEDFHLSGDTAYLLVVGYYWTNDLDLGKNLHRRIKSDDDSDLSVAEKYAFVRAIAELLLGFMEPSTS